MVLAQQLGAAQQIRPMSLSEATRPLSQSRNPVGLIATYLRRSVRDHRANRLLHVSSLR